MVLGLFVEQKGWAARSRSVSLYIHSTLNTIFAWIFRSRWERWITWTSRSTWETRPCRLVYDTFQLQIEQFFLFFCFFSFSCANSVVISIIIMCFQLDPYDCRVEFDVAYNKNCSNKFVGSYLCAFYHILQEKTSRLYHIRCLARRKTVAILRSYNRIYKSTMRSFIARQIANKRSRVQNGFDQILPKRSGYEIEFRIW